MGKCMVFPMGLDAERSRALDQAVGGSVVIGGERYELNVEAELLTEFALTIGDTPSIVYPASVDERKCTGYNVSNCAMTPDQSKLLFVCDRSDGSVIIGMLSMNTLQSYEVAVGNMYGGNGVKFLYLDNECLLAANQGTQFFTDIRFTDSSLRLEHQMNGGLVSDKTFFDTVLGVPGGRFAAERLSPYMDREAVAVWTTAYAGINRLTRYSYDKATHVLSKTASSTTWGGNNWRMNSRFVDEDTVLMVCDYSYVNNSSSYGAKILLYHPSTMSMVTGLEQEVFQTSSSGGGHMNIVRTGARSFAVAGHFQTGQSGLAVIEVMVGNNTVGKVGTLEESRLQETQVYQDGDRVWRSDSHYSTVDDLVTWKDNVSKIALDRITPKNTGEITVGGTCAAVPLSVCQKIFVPRVDSNAGKIFVGKSKKLMTTLKRVL